MKGGRERSGAAWLAWGLFWPKDALFMFNNAAQMEHMEQLGALTRAPGAAGMPREGRGEAPVQHIPSKQIQSYSRSRPFRRGGEGERARAAAAAASP